MKRIVFVDTEVDVNSKQVIDIGALDNFNKVCHTNSIQDFIHYSQGVNFWCGHNILQHDLPYLEKKADISLRGAEAIDTLYLSPLLFPTTPYHALLKDDKLQTEELNNPVNDAIKAKELLYDEINAFRSIEPKLQVIYYSLLKDEVEFSSFFKFIDFAESSSDLITIIYQIFDSQICDNVDLNKIINDNPIELAYSLALIKTQNRYSITPPWVLRNYPDVERVMFLLRNNPCLTGCRWCDQALDATLGLQKYFGFNAYRSFGGQSLQEDAVEAAIANKSLLAVFPTGGGKSITFQVPALMSGENVKGLTVVISPLQSLMKDQVDNLEAINITDAVTINGLLDPIERAKSIERIEDGSAALLYISPESLRSKTIERLLLGRNVVRFVIDEAHCFSSWGQDFRVDYLYIGDFIKLLQEKKNLAEPIPVSCFTATAKQQVIQDIKDYFLNKLSLTLEIYSSTASRTNLHYKVIPKENDDDKYATIRHLLDAKPCPSIIYVSRTRRAYQLAERLTNDGYEAKAYHGKMDKQEKSANQEAFIRGDVQIMVATSAFGMGVDKSDVGMVIHYEISDSLENYVQEAGRAGRDEKITADCYVLFNEEDLSKHFILLNQTKLHVKEIQQIWKAIKGLTKFRSSVSNSALEIARKAGWDDSVAEIETRVKTAISALEEAGYIKRGQNMPRIYANSILSKNAQEAIDKIVGSERFNEQQKIQGTRIIKKLFSSKNHQKSNDEAGESRIDYISDHLGIVKEEVINVVNLMREEKILADSQDLTAYIRRTDSVNKSRKVVSSYSKLESFLLTVLAEDEKTFHIKELNELGEKYGCDDISLQKLKTIINFWAIKNWIKRKTQGAAKNHISLLLNSSKDQLRQKLELRHLLTQFIVDVLFEKSNDAPTTENLALVEFSVQELKQAYEASNSLFKLSITMADVEDALFYLSRIGALKIEGGFLVVYNKLTLERLENDNLKRYTLEDYKSLKQFYESKTQQIHIVGEYAKKMILDYKAALQFVEDYFQLNYNSFLRKYFNVDQRKQLNNNITPAKFKKIFGELSSTQLAIINDKDSKNIAVTAGPGSGKTRILVHKLASLLLMEDVKHEQLLMLTFSRAAATEFKQRLYALIGNAAAFVEIKTFHSYCFDLLGKVGTLEMAGMVIKKAVESINDKTIEANQITKMVLVIDEAQDMDADEFRLVKALMRRNEDMRVIAVGDDDQNIYEFRGAKSEHLESFINDQKAKKYELVENFRSKVNLVNYTNAFAQTISHRLKQTPIYSKYNEFGQLEVIKYQSKQLITPVVNAVLSSDLKGTTCILTHTNAEALQLTGLLLKEGVKAKLIQSNDGFALQNILEVRYFLDQLESNSQYYIISDDHWLNAKRALWSKYKTSSNIDLCINLIKSFELSYPKKKYKSDFQAFVQESKLEDFVGVDNETIFVSTIHKAKGKEFDNVFIVLNNYTLENDAKRRELYVGMTRAKHRLAIHTNNNCLDEIHSEHLVRKYDNTTYPDAELLVLHLTHRDIWLDFFSYKQRLIESLKSGDKLRVNGEGCANEKGEVLLKFSTAFKADIKRYEEKGYRLSAAEVNYIVYWIKEGADIEIAIILPQLHFKKDITNG